MLSDYVGSLKKTYNIYVIFAVSTSFVYSIAWHTQYINQYAFCMPNFTKGPKKENAKFGFLWKKVG